MTLQTVLRARLERNVPVLDHLPEVSVADIIARLGASLTLVQYQAFALLLIPTSGLPPFEILPAVKHAASIADEACRLTQKYSPDVIVCLSVIPYHKLT